MTCSRHLRRSHYDDETVKRVFSMDAGRQKKDQQQLLINRGNFKHNIAVLKKKRGDLQDGAWVQVRGGGSATPPWCFARGG